MVFRIFFPLLALCLSACVHDIPQSSHQNPVVTSIKSSEHLFGRTIEIPTKAQVFALTQDQKQHFLEYFTDPQNARMKPHKRVHQYLSQIVDGFNYQGQTQNAADALSTQSGNCMSLAVLSGALSKLSATDIKYQLIDSIPVFDRNGRVNFRSDHIRTTVSVSDQNQLDSQLFFSRRSIVVDYIPSSGAKVSRSLTEDQFIATYFRNRAADLLAQDNHQESYWWLKAAQHLDAEHPELLNMLAIVHQRAGDTKTAEQYFNAGIALDDAHLSLLKNYHQLLIKLQKTSEAAAIDDKLDRIKDQSPFAYLDTALIALDHKDYRRAEYMFAKVIDIAPYMHQAHLGLAQTRFYMGDHKDAVFSMKEALEKIGNHSNKKIYQAKLRALQKLNDKQ